MPSPPRRVRGRIRVRHPRFGEKTINRSRLSSAEAGGWVRLGEPKPRRVRRRTAPESAPPDDTASASIPASSDPAQPDSEMKEQTR